MPEHKPPPMNNGSHGIVHWRTVSCSCSAVQQLLLCVRFWFKPVIRTSSVFMPSHIRNLPTLSALIECLTSARPTFHSLTFNLLTFNLLTFNLLTFNLLTFNLLLTYLPLIYLSLTYLSLTYFPLTYLLTFNILTFKLSIVYFIGLA